MPQQQPIDGLLEEYLEIWNDRDYSRIPDVVTDSFVLVAPTAGEVHGPNGLEKTLRGLAAGFSDFEIQLNDLLVSDDVAMEDGTLTGTHDGEFNGVPGTGREINLPFMNKIQIDEGKIREHRILYDLQELFRQLGIDDE